MEDLTKKINELYKKSQTEGLTEEEKTLQKELREKYLANVRRNFRVTLENVKFTDGGTKHKT